MNQKTRYWRPAAAAFLMMMAVALPTTALSFFNQPVAQDLGVGLGSLTIYYSIAVAAGALTAPFVGNFVSRYGLRPVMCISGIWGCIGFLLFSVSGSLWMFYVVAAIMGMLTTSCMSLCANVAVQSSYSSKDAAGIIGIVMAGSGVSGMIVSIVIPRIIENFGWRMGYRTLGVLWVALLYLAVGIIGKPEKAASQDAAPQPAEGMTRQEALHSKAFYMIFAVMLILGLCTGMSQHIPVILNTLGFDNGQSSTLMSVYTALLAAGKIFQGWLYGRVGVKKGGLITLCVYILSCLLLVTRSTAIPALLLLAIGNGIMSTLLPLVGKSVFGAREYAGIWGVVSVAGSIGSFLGAPAWGAAYDYTGSYRVALLCSAVLLVLALFLHGSMLKENHTD